MKAKLTSVVLVILLSASLAARAQDPLPSWNETAPKKAIIDFVERLTKKGSPDFVKPEERIATFDNDGTLWAEKPIYFQFQFGLDRVKALAPQHPGLRAHRSTPASFKIEKKRRSGSAYRSND
jgi:hypothetical protein